MAGMEGFEPPNAGTRTQCLTTWRHPISITNCTTDYLIAQVGSSDTGSSFIGLDETGLSLAVGVPN